MKPNFQTTMVLLGVITLAVGAFRQESELRRLRAAVTDLTGSPTEGIDSTGDVSIPRDLEQWREQAAEVYELRAQVTELRREKLESAALEAQIGQLRTEVAAVAQSLNRMPSFTSTPVQWINQTQMQSPNVRKANSLAQSSPEEAARFVASLQPGTEQDAAAMAVVRRWTGSDASAAATWVGQFAEGPLREQAVATVARQWGLNDWNATSDWLATLPPGASRDAAINSFVTSADGNDIQLALEWANAIEDPQQRAERVRGTASRWLNEDRAAARLWISGAQLPEGMAQRLLSEQ